MRVCLNGRDLDEQKEHEIVVERDEPGHVMTLCAKGDCAAIIGKK